MAAKEYQTVADERAAYLRALLNQRRPPLPSGQVPARYGLQPFIAVGTGAESVAPAATDSGVLGVFGAEFISGVDPANKFFTHNVPISEDWELMGFAFFGGMDRGAFGEMEVRVMASKESGLTTGLQLLRWQSRPHGANAWFEAARHVMLKSPFAIPRNSKLYFFWSATNLDAVARNFDLQAHLMWRYYNP